MDAPASAPKIGRIIKRAREKKRWSQQEAAGRLGVSRSALNAWENDRAYPRSSVGAIEELYGITLDDAPEPQPAVPADLLAAVMETRGLSDEERVAVIAAIDRTLLKERGASVSSSPAAGPERRRPAS